MLNTSKYQLIIIQHYQCLYQLPKQHVKKVKRQHLSFLVIDELKNNIKPNFLTTVTLLAHFFIKRKRNFSVRA